MPAYLVRTIDEHDIVGFFVADEMEDLLIAVECTEPDDCEYVELPVYHMAATQEMIATEYRSTAGLGANRDGAVARGICQQQRGLRPVASATMIRAR